MKRRSKEPEPEPGGIGVEIMTLHDVARFLNCHYNTVLRLVHRGKLPAFRLGSDYRFQRADLKRWIEGQHVETANVAPGPEPKVAKARPKAKA